MDKLHILAQAHCALQQLEFRRQLLNPSTHLGGVDLLRRVQQTSHVVVDGLVHGLALLQGLDLLVHEVEVLRLGVEGSHLRLLAAVAVKAVVVVQANNGGHVRQQGVGVGVAVCIHGSAGAPARVKRCTSQGPKQRQPGARSIASPGELRVASQGQERADG
eukprot:356567-Chlamydomonas_euryale.AAC.8